ncbi:hypothetical protein QTP88_027307 [Uroleucon formosanum]
MCSPVLPEKYDRHPSSVINRVIIGENYIYKESPVNKVSSRTESPIKKSNDPTEISLNRSNISTQLPKVNKLQIESDATNTLLPDTNSEVENNDNVDSQLFKHTEIIDSPHSRTCAARQFKWCGYFVNE